MATRTQSYSFLLFNSSGVVVPVTMPAYQMVVGRPDGTRLISSIKLYNLRKTGSTSQLDNGGSGKTYFQFFGLDGVALAAKADLIVASGTFQKDIAVPEGAYFIELTAIADGSAMYPATNSLQVISVEVPDYSIGWNLSKVPLIYDATYPAAKVGRIPASLAGFKYAEDEAAVSVAITPSLGDSFIAGSRTLTSDRDGYGYIKNAYVDLYKADGSLHSSTAIPYPTTTNTTRDTSVSFPAGITKAVVRGVKNHGGSASTSDSHLDYGFPTNLVNYGSALYSFTLTQDADGVAVSPGFYPKPPSAPYKTYVAVGSDAANSFVETDKVSALSGQTVFIKIELTAIEANTSQINNIALVNSPYKAASLSAELTRRISDSISTQHDSQRSVVQIAAAQFGSDLSRCIANSLETNPDLSRRTAASSENSIDSLRKTAATSPVWLDSSRQLTGSQSLSANLTRRTIQVKQRSLDTQRSIRQSASQAFDSLRLATATASCDSELARILLADAQTVTDTRRILTDVTLAAASIDLRRFTHAETALASDSMRRLIVTKAIARDSCRTVSGSIQFTADSMRLIHGSTWLQTDTARARQSSLSVLTDSKRRITSDDDSNHFYDLRRTINSSRLEKFDLARLTTSSLILFFDTKRPARALQVNTSDLRRKTALSLKFDSDTRLYQGITADFIADSARKTRGPLIVIMDTERETIEEEILRALIGPRQAIHGIIIEPGSDRLIVLVE